MEEGAVVTRWGVPYGHGQHLDLYGPVGDPASDPVPLVLLWHGSGPDERDVLGPLATRIAAGGVRVAVPDWRSDAPDGGADHLAGSVAYVRREVAGGRAPLVVCGWSAGATAGLDLVRRRVVDDGWRPDGFVGLAGGYAGGPFGAIGSAGPDPGIPVLLVHGSDDEVVPVQRTRVTASGLLAAGWRAEVLELPTDHAGVVGTRYDPARRRCVPSDEPDRRAVLGTVADRVADLLVRAGRAADRERRRG